MIFSRKVFWGATRPLRPPAMLNYTTALCPVFGLGGWKGAVIEKKHSFSLFYSSTKLNPRYANGSCTAAELLTGYSVCTCCVCFGEKYQRERAQAWARAHFLDHRRRVCKSGYVWRLLRACARARRKGRQRTLGAVERAYTVLFQRPRRWTPATPKW